jgi:hypothetical protein
MPADDARGEVGEINAEVQTAESLATQLRLTNAATA